MQTANSEQASNNSIRASPDVRSFIEQLAPLPVWYSSSSDEGGAASPGNNFDSPLVVGNGTAGDSVSESAISLPTE
jgi:hypothetical protein